MGNNCKTFVDALLDFVLDGEEEEEEESGGGRGTASTDGDDEDLDDAASVLKWILNGDDD